MTVYHFTVSCPRCRQGLTHCASGAPGLQTRTVAHCGRCKRDWMIVVRTFTQHIGEQLMQHLAVAA